MCGYHVCVLAKVNKARHCILQMVKYFEKHPTSQAALFVEHVKIPLLHASFYGNQVTFVHQEIPAFRQWVAK